MHLLTTPDGDPFGDDAAHARSHRVLMVSERAEFLALCSTLAAGDLHPEHYRSEYLAAWLNTAFHEIAHALVFAQNAALLAPADIENLSDCGEIHHDLFDCSTGYGIRPLPIDGQDIWSTDLDHAIELMEIHVETLGRQMMNTVLSGLRDSESFLDASNLRTISIT